MDLAVLDYFIIFILIGFAGFVDSIAGGGGLITVPTYISMGIPAHLVLGTNKTVSTIGTTVSIFRYWKSGLIYWRFMFPGIIASLIGSTIGAKSSAYLTKEIMLTIIVFIIPIILFLQNKIDVKGKSRSLLKMDFVSGFKCTFIGFFIGAYDGIFGPGTGTFLMIAFVMVLHMNYKEASANGRIINYISNLAAFSVFLYEGKIYWPIAGVAACGAILGNYLGSGLIINKADKIVGPMFKVVLSGLLAKCIYDLFIAS